MADPNPVRGSDDVLFRDDFEAFDTSAVPQARRVLERLSYGATPESQAEFLALGADDAARLQVWVDQQLDPASIDDSACSALIQSGGYQTLNKTLAQLWADHIRGSQNSGLARRLPVVETDARRLILASCSRRQLYERMVEFWHDHFNVFGWDFTIQAVFVHHDRDVIRPHALGNFRQMLEAVASSTAMLYYLDNRASRAGAFNENFARELLELHTMGAEVYYATNDPDQVPVGPDGVKLGYSDWDVYEAARAFTGWTVANGHWQFPSEPQFDSGEFLYWAPWHDAAGKFFLGEFILPNRPALEDGWTVLDRLVAHPATARHVCRKLIRRFVADQAPEALVESAAAVFRAHTAAPDQIARVLRHILLDPAAFGPGSAKIKRPYEQIAGALRKTGATPVPVNFSDWNPWGEFFNRLQQTGHGSFRWPAPNGYPDETASWSSSSVLGQSWRLLSRLPQMEQDGEPLLPILARTLAAFPDAAERTPRNLVDFWIDRALGHSPAPARRQQLIDFLRQNGSADDPLDLVTDAPFGFWSANNLSRHYNGARLNATVALILSLPEVLQR
ncbi:MAG: hypothetical protein CVV18_02565 [Gammaproteobacteria bacterium HGW-Gammaproteobacteria-8]|nr:MAG: hypothetical protein CVV18_02565 [Gammaproteobacteria bacterium HGW-Gammaproteobacteria-8]